VRSAVGGALCEHAADLGVIGVVLEEEIDEAGAGDLDLGDRGSAAAPHQRLGELARILARRLASRMARLLAKSPCCASRVRSTSMRRSRAARGTRISGKRGERLAQQCFDQSLQGGPLSNRKGSAVYRKALNRLRADRRRSTSAARRPGQRLDRGSQRLRKRCSGARARALDQQMRAKVIGAPRDQRGGGAEHADRLVEDGRARRPRLAESVQAALSLASARSSASREYGGQCASRRSSSALAAKPS
jgi:hypothetical protein